MEESTRALFETIASACREIGSANDLHDRGCPDEARSLRERAQASIDAALHLATTDDRERIVCLFGPSPLRRFDAVSWTTSEDYLLALLARDPELDVGTLRQRRPRFEAHLAELLHAPHLASLVVRYTRPFSPGLDGVFRKLIERHGDPAGWYAIGMVVYRLNLSGEGVRHELRESPPEPSDAIVDGTCIHVDLDRVAARTGLALTLRSADDHALARTRAALLALLAAEGWQEA